MVGFPGCAGYFFGNGFPFVVVGDDFNFAGLIANVVPHESVAMLQGGIVLLPDSLTFTVDEKFGGRERGVYEYGCDLSFAPFPIPVWQDVQGGVGIVPLGAIEVESVLGERCEVDNTEKRAVARPSVGVVGRGFAEVVESGPHELS